MTPNDTLERLAKTFAFQSPEWSRWLAHFQKSRVDCEIPSGDEAARELRRFLQLPEHITCSGTLKVVQRRFQIRESDVMTAMPGEGWARIGRELGGLPLEETEMLIRVGEGGSKRNKFVRAHEVAHHFFASFAVNLPEKLRGSDRLLRTEESERFCWQFAMELFCPATNRRKWTGNSLNALLRASERDLTATQHATGGPPLSYWHLRSLAGECDISIRAVIGALDRTPVLDELACGITVLRHSPNQWTGRECGHRIWQFARPSWGHIIFNQRAAKQGFRHAAHCYDDGKDQVTQLYHEELGLPVRSSVGVHWRRSTISARVAYTPVDVKREGRYIVAIWNWPPPIGMESVFRACQPKEASSTRCAK